MWSFRRVSAGCKNKKVTRGNEKDFFSSDSKPLTLRVFLPPSIPNCPSVCLSFLLSPCLPPLPLPPFSLPYIADSGSLALFLFCPCPPLRPPQAGLEAVRKSKGAHLNAGGSASPSSGVTLPLQEPWSSPDSQPLKIRSLSPSLPTPYLPSFPPSFSLSSSPPFF